MRIKFNETVFEILSCARCNENAQHYIACNGIISGLLLTFPASTVYTEQIQGNH